MKTLSRRDLLKTSLLAPAAAAAQGMNPIRAPSRPPGRTTGQLPTNARRDLSIPGAGRERLLLDFGWRFHFGDANDPAKDFGFGSGRTGNFQKTGISFPPETLPTTTATGAASICPTIGRSSCLSKRPRAGKQGLLPLGPDLPGDQRGLVSPHL